jgi:hypothetical protein
VQHDDAKRATKLRGLLKRLKQGKDVQNRDLQTWLGADGYAQYTAEWAAQKDLRNELRDKPTEIIEYERRLKRANFTYNRAERYSQQGKHTTAKRLFGLADTEFEGVLTNLQEIIAADPALCVWFDRETAWDADSENTLHPEKVPQVVTSKSPFNRTKSGGILQRKQSKHEVKKAAVEWELERIKQATATKRPKRRSVVDLLKVVKDGD